VVRNLRCGSLARKKAMILIAPNAGQQNRKLIPIEFVGTGNKLMEAEAPNHNIFGLEVGLRIRGE